MTAREEIKKFLTGKRGYVPSRDVHNHIVSLGYNRKSSNGTLSKMLSRGELITTGHHHNTSVKLNTSYRPSAASARQTANHAYLGKAMRKNPAKPERKANNIFDLCRNYSRVYQLIDQPLREVRL